MTRTRSLSIKRNGAGHEVLVDGHDLSHAIQTLSLDMRAGQMPRVDLMLNIFDVTQFGDAEMRLAFAPGVEEALIALGWTPPGSDARGGKRRD